MSRIGKYKILLKIEFVNPDWMGRKFYERKFANRENAEKRVKGMSKYYEMLKVEYIEIV